MLLGMHHVSAQVVSELAAILLYSLDICANVLGQISLSVTY